MAHPAHADGRDRDARDERLGTAGQSRAARAGGPAGAPPRAPAPVQRFLGNQGLARHARHVAELSGSDRPPATGRPLLTEPGDRDEQRADASVAALLGGPGPLPGPLPSPEPPPSGGSGGSGELPPAVHAVLAELGRPFRPVVRSWAEGGLGRDLGHVRVHTGPTARRSARELDAAAYTVGGHIVLGLEDGETATGEAHRLLAHELGHVVEPPRHAVIGRSDLALAPFRAALTGDHPASAITDLVRVCADIAGITLDAEAMRLGVPADVLKPTTIYLYTDTHIAVLRPDGGVVALAPQDPGHKVMVNAPVAVLSEPHTGRVWLYGTRGGHPAIQSDPLIFRVPDPAQPPGRSVLLAYMPGVPMPPELVASLQRRERGLPGSEAEAPDWARDAVHRLRRRRGAARGGAGDSGAGPGAGRRGAGRGGGGTAQSPTGTGGSAPTSEALVAPGSGERQGAGLQPRPAAPGPLQGPSTYRAQVGPTGSPQVRITIDRASRTVAMRGGESAASFDRRVDAAEEALQRSRDPGQSRRIAGGATTTAILAPGRGSAGATVSAQDAKRQAEAAAGTAGGAQTPGERVPGDSGGANAPSYPSSVTMAGIEPTVAAVSVSGATNRFTMKLDYAARSLGSMDETFNRLQDVQFYWELIDVSGLTPERARDAGARTALGGGQAQGAYSGAGGDLARTARNVAEDQQADIHMMREQDWPWEARAAYLTVIGLSNTVRLLGSVVGSFIDVLTQPLHERSIGFAGDGDYLVRCVATPLPSDEARADPEHHVIRASSVAVLPVRIADVNVRAAEVADREANDLAAARAALRAAEASGNPRTIAAARAALQRAVATSRLGGLDLFTQTLSGLRREVMVARQLQEHTAAQAPDSALSDEEVLLQLKLIQSRQPISAFLEASARRLEQFGGKGGEHETWVTAQHGHFLPVGGVTDFRPRLALASEENGQVTEVRCMLGELQGSVEGRRRWALVDITSPATRDVYTGTSTLSGHAGQVAAIRDTFRNFAENAGYGRGTLAIRLPPELSEALEAPVSIEPAMSSAPGARGRALQRLSDLATVAEIAGLFATGGLGVAIGAVGGVAGAITAADALARRARTGHVLEIGTVFDVLGGVGAVASTMSVGTFIARDVAEAGRAAGKLPPWIDRLERTERALHVYGRVGNVQQLVTVPVQLALEWAEIDRAEGLSEGERDARRARALLGALRSGAVTVVSMGGGLGGPGGSATRATAQGEPLPRGTGAAQAHALAEGTGPARPTRAGDEGTAGARSPVSAAHAVTAAPEPVPGPSLGAQVARAREMGARRLAEARGVEAGREGGPPARETARARGEDDAPAVGEARTAVGTPRGPAGRGTPAPADVNAAERTRVVEILGQRVGLERPTARRGAEPAPRPGPYGSRTMSAAEAVATYDRAVTAAAGAEVGLFFNPHTGELAVQVGTEAYVRPPVGDGWQALIHLHPNAENIIVRRLPAPADIALAARTAFRTGSHTEFVQSTRPDGTTGLTRVTVTTDPVRIVVEMPAAPGEPPRRIEVDSPEAYAREYGRDTTFLDPADPMYEWVMRDLDDFYRLRRRDSEDSPESGEPEPRTAMGLGRLRPDVPSQVEAESVAEIARLRGRLYSWRRAARGNADAQRLIDDHLATLRTLRAAVRNGVSVEGALLGIRESLPAERRLLRPVDPDRVGRLVDRSRRAAARSRTPDTVAELNRIAGEAQALADRMAAEPGYDARVAFDTLNRELPRAARKDYEVFVDLGDAGVRAEMVGWFERNLTPLHADPIGELLAAEIVRHLESADVLTLQQSPRGAGTPVADTAAMRRHVLDAVAAGRYPPEYVALFEVAARGHDDGWPRTPDGRAWEVDHVAELWLGGADDASNYLALPPAVHDLKTTILGDFRAEYRTRGVPGEQVDWRATQAPEPAGEGESE